MDALLVKNHPSNFKFVSLLNASPFSEEERYNIYTIFSVLRDERKLHILDHWGEHLEKLLSIRIQIDSERHLLVQDTFEKIVHEIDDVYLRHQQEELQRMRESRAKGEDMLAAMNYDARMRKKQILQVQYRESKERQKINDPLSVYF